MTILQDRNKQIFASGILRLVGYGLLSVAIANLLFLFFSVELTSPLWEFQTMGAIVERLPFALLGMVLIYYGEASGRRPLEATILKLLSWFSLLLAIALILTIPLSISDSFEIYSQHNTTTDARFISDKDTIEQLKAANSKAEIGVILQQQAKQQINIPDSIDIEKLKTDIIANLQYNQDTIISQAEAFRAQKKSLLLKKCLKWNLGALIASILFFKLWKNTGWARSTSSITNY